MQLTFLIPGALDARTGGTRYDVRLAEALVKAGTACDMVALAGNWPGPEAIGMAALDGALAVMPSDRLVVVDGLCLAALAARRAAPPFVALMHHPADLETGLAPQVAARLRAGETRALARAARVVATSAHTAALLVRDYDVAAPRLGVVPPGVIVAPDPAGARTRPAGPVRLLAVAGVTPRKGYDVLLDAVLRMHREHPSLPAFRLDCYGSLERDRSLANRVLNMISAAGLGDCVRLHGEVDEGTLARAYGEADLFVHAAHYEGYGMAIADALAAALPVVATVGGAVADLVPDAAGLLVAPGDSAALAAALARVIGDAVLRDTLAAGARQAGANLPDWPQAADLFAAMCRGALS